MLLLFQDLRIATTVAVVIGLFVICWTPFFGLNFGFAVCMATLSKGAGCSGLMTLPFDFPWILSVNKWLQYGNSVCNPVIYGFRNKDFRRAFRKILVGLCCKKVRLSDYSKSAYGRTVRSGRWSAINERWRLSHFKWIYFQYECLEFVFRGFRLSSGAL